MDSKFYLVTIGGRVMGTYINEQMARTALSPIYQEKVRLLTSEEFSDWCTADKSVMALKSLGILLN